MSDMNVYILARSVTVTKQFCTIGRNVWSYTIRLKSQFHTAEALNCGLVYASTQQLRFYRITANNTLKVSKLLNAADRHLFTCAMPLENLCIVLYKHTITHNKRASKQTSKQTTECNNNTNDKSLVRNVEKKHIHLQQLRWMRQFRSILISMDLN